MDWCELPATPVPRSLLKRPLGSTSTPLQQQPQQTRRLVRLRSLREPSESPILEQSVQVKLNWDEQSEDGPAVSPVEFDRKYSPLNFRFSPTVIAASLDKMEICDNHHSITKDKNENDIKTEKIKNENKDTSISSLQEQEEFQKQINLNTKKKSLTPKRKSPKIYKIGAYRKVIGLIGTTKKKSPKNKNSKSSKVIQTSPKNKSPKTLKILRKSPKTKGIKILKRSPKKIDTNLTECSNKNSVKKLQLNSGQCSALKESRCPKSPKLHTAERAALRQHREELKKEKEKLFEEIKIKILEEQKREEEKELLRLRQQTVFKAKPIRKYAPLPTVKKRPLTDPVSPNISKRRRLENFNSHNSNSHQNH